MSGCPVTGSAIQKYLQTLCNETMEVGVHGLDSGGLGDEFRIFEYFDTANVIRNALKAGRLEFDAVAIGDILDPGLWEARQVSDVTQMMVRFRETTGVFVSRRMTFSPPDEKRWAEAQEIYKLG